MDLEFTWINLLILFGALQGLIFGLILLSNKKHPGAKFLAVFMLILSYNGFETFSWSSGFEEYTLFFDIFGLVLVFGLGPSLYLYLAALLKPDYKLSIQTVFLWYSPLILQLLVKLTMLGSYIIILPDDIPDWLMVYISHFNTYSEPASVIVFIIYLALSVRLFIHSQRKNLLPKSTFGVIFGWVKALLICLTILAFLWPLILLVPVFRQIQDGAYYYPLEILLVFFIYWIAFVGYHKIKMINPLKNPAQGINHSDAEQHLVALKTVMEQEKLYLDPELNREKVANHLGISAKIISAVLNQYADQNFNDFVNTYRVKEVTSQLSSGESSHLTISGIAFEAGFNSQATFQRVFKSIQGMSPKEFQKTILRKNDH